MCIKCNENNFIDGNPLNSAKLLGFSSLYALNICGIVDLVSPWFSHQFVKYMLIDHLNQLL